MSVEFQTKGRVAVLTINRPEARNAVNGEVAQAMEAGIDRLEDDAELWAGVVASTGPVFSAGADLKVIASGRPQDLLTERGGFAGIARRERRKPLVAAVVSSGRDRSTRLDERARGNPLPKRGARESDDQRRETDGGRDRRGCAGTWVDG